MSIKGTCPDCIEAQKKMPDHCCALCAMGLNLGADNVVKDPFTGTVHIDLSDPNHPFWGGPRTGRISGAEK